MKEICEKKPFYIDDDGDICCVKCDTNVNRMDLRIADIVIDLDWYDDREYTACWSYGKVSLICACGIEKPENAYTWECHDDGDWRLTIKEDAIENRREGRSCPDGR